jgi:hypothetical protein
VLVGGVRGGRFGVSAEPDETAGPDEPFGAVGLDELFGAVGSAELVGAVEPAAPGAGAEGSGATMLVGAISGGGVEELVAAAMGGASPVRMGAALSGLGASAGLDALIRHTSRPIAPRTMITAPPNATDSVRRLGGPIVGAPRIAVPVAPVRAGRGPLPWVGCGPLPWPD